MKEATCYHLLVRPHPITDEPVLWSPCGTNTGVVGWTSQESFNLLAELTRHALLNPAFRYDHMWKLGDVLMYDNSLTMHRGNPLASATGPEDTRVLLRVSNQGVNPAVPNGYRRGVHYDVDGPNRPSSTSQFVNADIDYDGKPLAPTAERPLQAKL